MKASQLYLILVFVVIIPFIWSCTRKGPADIALEGIESIIMSRPDSAMQLLDEIDTLQFVKDRQKAMYGMLYTMASDKVYRDPKDEALIDFAAEYFKKKGDVRREMISRYYKGRVLFHKEKFPEALISFYSAKELGEKQEDYFYMGMSCRGISDTYHETSSSADELIYAKKEFEYLQKSGVQPYINYALLDLAHAYNNKGEDKDVESLTNQIIDSAIHYKDDYLYYCGIRIKGCNLLWMKNYQESNALLKELFNSPYVTSLDSLYYILNLINREESKEAEILLQKMSNTQSAFQNFVRFRLMEKKLKMEDALYELEWMNDRLDNQIKNKRNINLSSSLAENFELTKRLDAAEIERQKFKVGFILSTSLFIFLILIFIYFQFIKRYNRKIFHKTKIIEEIQESLSQNIDRNNKSQEIIRQLLGTQYNILKDAGSILYQYKDDKKTRKQIVDMFYSTIKSISVNGNDISSLEKQVNNIYDNLMKDFRKDLPSLKETDYILFLYCVLDFPSSLITLLMEEEKVEIIYNRKRHLKDKIKKLNQKEAERYLSFL